MSETICMKVGDRRPVLRVRLALKGDPSGSPLENAVAVRFRMVNRETGIVKVDDAVGLIESIEQRTVSYAWQAGDTDTAGTFEAWFRVDYGSGVVQTFPSCDGFQICID